MNSEKRNFSAMLTARRRRWQFGLLLRDAIRAAGYAAIGLLAYAALDFFVAFESRSLVMGDLLLGAALCAVLVRAAVRNLRLTDRDMARRADRIAGDPRREFLSAFELSARLGRHAGEDSELGVYLAGRAIESAARNLGRLRFRDYFPTREVWRQAKVFVAQVCVAALAVTAQPAASNTILGRIFVPTRDTPPYSAYSFRVAPGDPSVIYGGDIEISALITGAPVRSQVWFVTRFKGKTFKSACFRGAEQSYAQRLEKVIQPVEFCFATGKARSRWHKVGILLQPQIAVARVELAPPPYSRLPKREFFAGNEELAALKHSKARLSLTSNRPLLDGTATVRSADRPGTERLIQSDKTGASSLSFAWDVEENGEVEVSIRDVRGTRSRDPLRLRQKLVPDAPPAAGLTEPPAFSLATPAATMPLAGYAEDDLGLNGVELVSAVVGYYDRVRPLPAPVAQRRFEFEKKLDLKRLGVECGQVLEFYLEASDLNPELMGSGASEIARVLVISEKEYAEMLRARFTIEDFAQRFRRAVESLNRLEEALKGLRDSVAAGTREPAGVGRSLGAARQLNIETLGLYEAMLNDFALYDMEASFNSALAGAVSVLKRNGETLAGMNDSDPDIARKVSELLQSISAPTGAIRRQAQKADDIVAIARLLECAARYGELVKRQAQLVRRLERFVAAGSKPDIRQLPGLGRTQDSIREELVQVQADLIERAAKLPLSLHDLADQAKNFADTMTELEIPDLMTKAVRASENQDGQRTHHFAQLALERMKEAPDKDKCKGFGGCCRGNMPGGVGDDLKSTLRQMMNAMGLKPCVGDGGGDEPAGGIGAWGAGLAGGYIDDGYWMSGYSPVNIPLYGPERLATHIESGAQGGGKGECKLPGPKVARRDSERMNVAEPGNPLGERMPIEEMPEKYRDALIRYFAPETR